MALATLVHMTGQNVRDYGFESAQPYAPTVFQVGTLGLNDAEAREKALRKWAQWRAEHPES